MTESDPGRRDLELTQPFELWPAHRVPRRGSGPCPTLAVRSGTPGCRTVSTGQGEKLPVWESFTGAASPGGGITDYPDREHLTP